MFIFSNLAVSLDGKIGTQKRILFPIGTPEDRRHMLVLRGRCDGILVGASTFRSYKKPSLASPGSTQPFNMILSSNLQGISPNWPFFTHPTLRRILFVNQPIAPSRLKAFGRTSEIVVLKKPTAKNPTPLQIIRFLETRGIQRLLLEGGGGLMWDFVNRDLVDEYHVTLTPRILGGAQAPTLVDGKGFNPDEVVNLKLSQCRIVGDELYLIYRKTGKRGRL